MQTSRNLGGRGPLHEKDVEPRHMVRRISNRCELCIARADDEIGKAALHAGLDQQSERMWGSWGHWRVSLGVQDGVSL